MKLPTITFPQEALSHFDEAIEREWLITNGLGGYASSTVLEINTRKYHGLLVAALHPPGDRTVCLSKLDEDVIVGNDVYRLGANDFQNVIYPQGHKLIKQFSIAPFPTYTYDLANLRVKKTIFMPKNKNSVSAIYTITNSDRSEATFKIYPLLTCRYYHTTLNRQKIPLVFNQKSTDKEFEINFQRPQATIVSKTTDGVYKENVNWVERLFYREEAARGESNIDDCFQPGYFEIQISAGLEKQFAITLSASPEAQVAKKILDTTGTTADEVVDAFNRELEELGELPASFYHLHPKVPVSDWLNWILLAADSFIVQNAAGRKSIIAGYPWFEPWGRDTFISLPGLMLVTGRFSEAKDILQNFIQYCKDGLIPNFVADKTGQPVYNTVDGTFWYVNAVLQYLKYTGDFGFVTDELWENLQSIIDYHQSGTLNGIHLDDDGLIMHGPRLTWMDAAVEGEGITPRSGKAVEIQALWYNALRTMELLANKFGAPDLSQKYGVMAEKTRKSFNEKYWNPQLGCLNDVLNAEGADPSIRPNQIFAVSMDYTMLDIEKSAKVVDVVNRQLLTPYGLRTLSLDDPKFVGKCFSNRRSRDTAYHNGTIWPWLLGPYITAYLKVNGYTTKSRNIAFSNLVLPLFSVGIHHGGLGSINEIYDCDPPNEPRGCISQAWSVAEPLRAYVEDVLLVKPRCVTTNCSIFVSQRESK